MINFTYERDLQNSLIWQAESLFPGYKIFGNNLNGIEFAIDGKRIEKAVLCLSTLKEYYNQEDIVLMRQIFNLIDELPDTGKIESVKSGLMGKEKEKFVCENIMNTCFFHQSMDHPVQNNLPGKFPCGTLIIAKKSV